MYLAQLKCSPGLSDLGGNTRLKVEFFFFYFILGRVGKGYNPLHFFATCAPLGRFTFISCPKVITGSERKYLHIEGNPTKVTRTSVPIGRFPFYSCCEQHLKFGIFTSGGNGHETKREG